MNDTKQTIKVSARLEESADVEELQIVDPIKDLDLGDTAYKVVRADMADTEKQLKDLDLSYYHIRGGEVVKKEFNDPVERKSVIFNKDLPDEFEIPLSGKRRSYDALETWYPNKKQALALAKELSMVELEKSMKLLKKHQEAAAFIEDQLNNNKF